MTESSGLYDKYTITKTDGSAVDPNAHYFVLRVDTDPHAREAILAYADSLELADPHNDLIGDIRNWISVINWQRNHPPAPPDDE